MKESTKMDSVNVLNQMAEYDFNAPIKVTMIFEDSDDETDRSFENIREEENIPSNNNNNRETVAEKCASECLEVNKNKRKPYCLKKNNNRIHKNKPKFEDLSKKVLGRIVNNKNTLEKIRKNINHAEDQHNANKYVSNIPLARNEVQEDTENNENTVETFVEDLLDKLSENLLMIIQSFYYYELKTKKSSPIAEAGYHKLKKTFCFIKSHFFEVSYTTMESIILPLEQNSPIIDQFLDNTMMIAKIKFLNWSFHRHHVQALFNELLMWSKQKQTQMKTIRDIPNGHFNLRQHLNRPPPPYPVTNLNNAPVSKNVAAPRPNTPNNMWCIFRSGAPGNQISINVNPDTLLSCTTKDNTENRNTFASNGDISTRNASVALPPYNNCHNYYRQSPHLNQNTVHTTQNTIHNRYNTGQQHQNHQNTCQPIHNHRTQVPYANENRTSPFGSELMNPLRYDYIHVNNDMHERLAEQPISSLPVITNVTSINPKAYTNARCCMCGKFTEQRHYGLSLSPARPTYCSNLCQELDDQIRHSTSTVLRNQMTKEL